MVREAKSVTTTTTDEDKRGKTPSDAGEGEDGKEERTGEDGKTQRDMQSVTTQNDEQPLLDIRKMERAIDMLVKVREGDKRTTERPFVPSCSLRSEDVKYFMEKTKVGKVAAERYLDAAHGDLKEAFKAWMQAPTGLDYESLYPKKTLAQLILE